MSETSWSSFTTPEDTWCERHVKVLDGSTVSMPDTNDNQEAYPQPDFSRDLFSLTRSLNFCISQA